MVGKRDVCEKAARLILEIAEHREVRDAISKRLHMAVEHRAVGANAQLVRLTMHGDPLVAGQLLVGDGRADPWAEDFSAAARHGIEASLTEGNQGLANAHLLDACDVCDLDSGERLDVDVRKV